MPGSWPWYPRRWLGRGRPWRRCRRSCRCSGSTSAVMASTVSVAGIHEAHGPGGGGRGLGDGILDVLRPFGAAGKEDAPGGRIDGLELRVGLQVEAVGGLSAGPASPGSTFMSVGRFKPDGEDHHLGPVCFELVGGRVFHGQDQVSWLPGLPGRSRADPGCSGRPCPCSAGTGPRIPCRRPGCRCRRP